MNVIRSPHDYSKTATQQTKFNGHRMAHDCHRWMERNECTFKKMLRFVHGLRHRGIKGRVRDHVACYCIQAGLQVGERPYRFANAYWAGIARYMVLLDPTLKDDPIILYDSDIDTYGLLPVSWMEI